MNLTILFSTQNQRSFVLADISKGRESSGNEAGAQEMGSGKDRQEHA